MCHVAFTDRQADRPSFASVTTESTSPARPSTVAIIPARGGSKGVPGKNLRRVGGIPLIARAVAACLGADSIQATYVSTDDPQIAEVATAAGAEVIWRPRELADDQASSESALLHALEVMGRHDVEPRTAVFVQCTSPFIDPADLDRAVRLIEAEQADTVFSGVSTYEFLWGDAHRTADPASGAMTGLNHDAAVRPRRQDRSPHVRETGAFYAMTTAGLRRHGHRFFGRVRCVLVPDETAIEIDTPAELALAQALAAVLDRQSADLGDVEAVITDFDGVHTDDRASVDQHGIESVRVSRTDGLGVARLRRAGLPFLIVSTERNPVVAARAAKLGVEVFSDVRDKAAAVLDWLAMRGIDPARTVYVGNDVNDLPALEVVGWPVAVADANPEVIRAARLVLSRPGGAGAVRELCELVLEGRRSDAAGTADRGRQQPEAQQGSSPNPNPSPNSSPSLSRSDREASTEPRTPAIGSAASRLVPVPAGSV
jgi:YrbI family 3-deoxy-D-manno-octulosonate 8-phosphate phosphatase